MPCWILNQWRYNIMYSVYYWLLFDGPIIDVFPMSIWFNFFQPFYILYKFHELSYYVYKYHFWEYSSNICSSVHINIRKCSKLWCKQRYNKMDCPCFQKLYL